MYHIFYPTNQMMPGIDARLGGSAQHVTLKSEDEMIACLECLSTIPGGFHFGIIDSGIRPIYPEDCTDE